MGDGEGREELARSGILRTCGKTHASQRYLQAAKDFVVVSDVLSKFSKIENLFFFRGSVRCQHQLKLHTFEHE